MSASDYALSLILLAAVVVPAAVAGRAVRTALLPAWNGAPALLAESVVAVLMLVLVGQLLGVLGAFRAWLLVLASVLTGGAVALLAPRLGRWRDETGAPRKEVRPGRPVVLLCCLGAAMVVGEWLVGVRASFEHGMSATDTVWYHMPFAADFVQQASITHTHFVELQPITAYFPANSELLHGFAIALFSSHDVLSPLFNIGFLGLTLLAGWCIGRPSGLAPITMLAAAVAASQPGVWVNNAGQAGNDLAGLAFFLAAVALLVTARENRVGTALAALAAGLAVGTKLTMIGPALAVAAVAILLAPRRRRLAYGAIWTAGLAVPSAVWYLRNLAVTGNPAPWFGLHFGPLSLDAPPRRLNEGLEYSVAHYLTDTSVWRHYFAPGLKWGVGWGWWLILGLAVLGTVTALLARGDRWRQALAALAVVCAVVYLVTPSGAAGHEGTPDAFGQTFRYAAPAVALGLMLLPPWLAVAWRRGREAAVALFLIALALTLGIRTDLWHERRETLLLGLAAAAAGAVAIGLARMRSEHRHAALAGAAVLVVALAGGGFVVQRHYLRERYTAGTFNTPAGLTFARDLRHTRIAVFGSVVTYQLYGRDLSNRISYIGRHEPDGGFTTLSSCPEWRAALNRGRYSYVVVAPVVSPLLPWGVSKAAPQELRWTSSDPAAHPIASAGGASVVFKVRGEFDPRSCPPSAAS